MSTGFGSVRERQDRQLIHGNTEVGRDLITSDKIILLPVFNIMSPNEIVKGIKVAVLESHYNLLTLSARKIFMSFDIDENRNYKDQRPFVYAGDPGQLYSDDNDKIRLVHLIMGAYNNPLFDNNTLINVKLDPFGYHDNNPCNLVPHNIIPPEGIKIEGLPIKLDFEQTPIERERVNVTEKLVKAINNHNKNLSVSEMEQLILDGFKPTSTDAIKDENHRWLGVSSKETAQGKRYVSVCKGQNLGTYENPVDAARAYNDFVIDNGLPYPVNNIPGFLKLKFVTSHRKQSLQSFEAWELANELSRKLMPAWMKF